MEKEKLKNKKIEENNLEKVSGGYTPHTYYFSLSGKEEDAQKDGYITVSKEEYDLLKENNYLNPHGGIDSRYVDEALLFLGNHDHPRDKVTDSKKDSRDLYISLN